VKENTNKTKVIDFVAKGWSPYSEIGLCTPQIHVPLSGTHTVGFKTSELFWLAVCLLDSLVQRFGAMMEHLVLTVAVNLLFNTAKRC